MTRPPRRAAAALALAALAGCAAVGPDYHVPDQAIVNQPGAAAPFVGVGTGDGPTTGAPLPPQWWRLYHDPLLDRLVQQAFAANTDLRVAAANLQRARGSLQQTRSARLPSVDVGAGPVFGRESGTANYLPERIPDTWGYDIGVNVGYQVDLYGKIARAVEASTADAQAVQAAYDLARVSVAAETTRAYVEGCATGEEILIAQQAQTLQREFAALTARRVANGRGTALDNSRARGLLEQVNASLPPLLARQRSAHYRLAVLLGRLPGAVPADAAACHAVPQLAAAIPVGDGAALLKRRPDVRQAERGLAAASARIGVATADLYPSISLGASFGSTGALPQFGAPEATRWSIGPLISWTLPISGGARARVAQAGAASDAALAHFDGTVLGALRETESALTVYARELDRHAALQAAREQNALAARQAETLQRAGRSDFLTALDAQRSLTTADAALATSTTQVALDQVALFLALGGGWEAPQQAR